MTQDNRQTEFTVSGTEVKNKVKELIEAGNIRRIILKNQSGKTLFEIPLSYGAIGATVGIAVAPLLAAVGAAAAVMTSCTIVVEKIDKNPQSAEKNTNAKSDEPKNE